MHQTLKRISVIGVSCFLLAGIFTGCAGRELLQTVVRSDVKEEKVLQDDLFADFRPDPATSQQQKQDGVFVTVDFLRVMQPSDYECIKGTSLKYDPQNPRLLMAFMMLNTSEKIREYNPVFVFKGIKSVDFKDDPCRFFKDYGALNYVLAKEGNRVSLRCGEGSSQAELMDSAGAGQTVTLYPDVPVYGIILVGTENLDLKLEPGNPPLVSTIQGKAAFFERTLAGVAPVHFRFDYVFERKDQAEKMLYSQKTPFTYTAEIYRKFVMIPALGAINKGTEDVKLIGSEKYGTPELQLLGPAPKQ